MEHLLAPLASFPDAHAAGLRVLSVGAAFRSLQPAAIEEAAAVGNALKTRLAQSHAELHEQLETLVAGACSRDEATANIGIAALESRLAEQRKHVAVVARALKAPDTPAVKALSAAAADFRAALHEFEEVTKAIGHKVPWQLRYAAEVETGSDGSQTVAFNCDMENAAGLGIFEDTCAACGLSIQNGYLEIPDRYIFAQTAEYLDSQVCLRCRSATPTLPRLRRRLCVRPVLGCFGAPASTYFNPMPWAPPVRSTR